MALRASRDRPGEVSLTKCPFPECGMEIAETESFVRHWPECAANPVNGGVGAFPSDRNGDGTGGG